MGLQVSIDPDLCIGSGDCERLLPQAFQLMDELGVSVPRPEAASADPAGILAAARGCPTQAIRVIDGDGTVLHAANGD
jgi:ferredoxin